MRPNQGMFRRRHRPHEIVCFVSDEGGMCSIFRRILSLLGFNKDKKEGSKFSSLGRKKKHSVHKMDDAVELTKYKHCRTCSIVLCLTQMSSSVTSAAAEADEVPRFEQPLRNISVPKGKTAIFTCRLCGRPRPTVQWRDPSGRVLSIGELRTLQYTRDA